MRVDGVLRPRVRGDITLGGDGEPRFNCPKCNVKVAISNLEEHLQFHQPQQLQCEICQKTFEKEFQLQEHVQRHEKYHCEMCGQMVRIKHKLLQARLR